MDQWLKVCVALSKDLGSVSSPLTPGPGYPKLSSGTCGYVQACKQTKHTHTKRFC